MLGPGSAGSLSTLDLPQILDQLDYFDASSNWILRSLDEIELLRSVEAS